MNRLLFTVSACALCLGLGAWIARSDEPKDQPPKGPAMRLGAFSVSLAVKDLTASRAFYEKLGFAKIGGNDKNYVILQNDHTTIGLFQGMFEKNILTFNPGWDHRCNTLPAFDDVREIQRRLTAAGIEPSVKADPAGTGPAHLVITDPDGNAVMFDQHVPKPAP